MKKQLWKIIFFSLSLTLASCGSSKSPLQFGVKTAGFTPLEVAGELEKDQAYLSVKKNLFDASCVKCHNPETAAKKDRADLTKKEVILENLDDIIYRMTDAFETGEDYMPPKGPRVTPEVIKQLKSWASDAKFAGLQKSLFEVSCLKCHGANQKKHANLSSKAVVLENFDDIIYRMTDAFDAGDEFMPPKGNRVSPELINELKKWKESL